MLKKQEKLCLPEKKKAVILNGIGKKAENVLKVQSSEVQTDVPFKLNLTIAALPPDVRKGFAFPRDSSPISAEAKPQIISAIYAKAKPFRTSAGKALSELLC